MQSWSVLSWGWGSLSGSATLNLQDILRTTLKLRVVWFYNNRHGHASLFWTWKFLDISGLKTAENHFSAITGNSPTSWHCKDGVGVEGCTLFHLASLLMGRRKIASSHSTAMKKSSTCGLESCLAPRPLDLLQYSAVIPNSHKHSSPTHLLGSTREMK